MNFIADETIIFRSPDAASIYCYTPALGCGFANRLIAAVDLGGPGTDALEGPRSECGDYRTGNQIRIFLSDDRGEHWRESHSRLPMRHEIFFRAGKALYMIGNSPYLVISRSLDNGEHWSEPAVLEKEHIWHQSCGAVDVHNGKVYLVYEQFQPEPIVWPGVMPVLMAGDENADLTRRESWRFSEPFNPDSVAEAARPSGIPCQGHPGILESNVLRMHNPQSWFYDPEDRKMVILMRANTGFDDIGAVLEGVEDEDGTLRLQQPCSPEGRKMFYIYLPGGNMKFHIQYDAESRLYWMIASQMDGRCCNRRRLGLFFSPDLLHWTCAGLVAVGTSENGARHYATLAIDGADLYVLSRSGDINAKNAHDNNLVTFLRVKNFRQFAQPFPQTIH